MAIQLVNGTTLDANLTTIANAIRAKSGGSTQLSFPSGFVSEIENISNSSVLMDSFNLNSLFGSIITGEYTEVN